MRTDGTLNAMALSTPTWKARQLQEAVEAIPTLQQQRGDVISARVDERLRVLYQSEDIATPIEHLLAS